MRDEHGEPEVLAGHHDRHHRPAGGGDEPGRGRGAVSRPGGADADGHVPGLDRRTAVHVVHEPASRPRSLGYTPQDWYDDDDLFDKLVHPDDVERAAHAPESAGVHDADVPAASRGTATRCGSTTRRDLILDDEGSPKYWQGVLVDITEHMHAQELERDLTVEREAAQRLRAVDEMKNTFLQAVSHDLQDAARRRYWVSP